MALHPPSFILVLLLLLLLSASGAIAATNTANRSAPIPLDQLGAVAGRQYQGDGLSVAATPEGARLHCVFQRLEGQATSEGLWLTSTVTNQTSDRFQIKAARLGRAACAWALADTGTVRVDPQAVSFIRPGLTEEYSVSLDGVQQDFTIEQEPPGEGELRVELAVSGAKVEPLVKGVRLTLDGSGRKLAYSRLRATDATDKELPARMEIAKRTSDFGFRISDFLSVVVDNTEAVYPIRIDPTFSDANWISMNPGIPGADGSVFAAAVDGSGNLYIGGSFTFAGDVFANIIAKWDGTRWSVLGSGMDGYVYALAVSGSDLYAGGWFTTMGGVSANNIAKWNCSAWSALGEGIDGAVNALAVSGSDLYAGGEFTMAGDKVSLYLARAVLSDTPGCNRLTGALLSGGAMQFSYIGYPATNYALDRAFNLTPPICWVGRQTNTMTFSGVLLFTNTPAPGTNNFWRVRSVP